MKQQGLILGIDAYHRIPGSLGSVKRVILWDVRAEFNGKQHREIGLTFLVSFSKLESLFLICQQLWNMLLQNLILYPAY